MSAAPAFSITYWGLTGTFPDPLRPAEVTDKIVHSIESLVRQGALASLTPGPNLREQVRQLLSQVPFHQRSTFGGNTTCIEIQSRDTMFILDCGSGFRELGREMDRRWNAPGYTGNRTAHVLVTHPHMDHTFSTPYFSPYFDPRNSITIWGTAAVIASLDAVLSPTSTLSKTYFPPTFDMMKAIKQFRTIEPNQEFTIGDTSIRTCSLVHPGGCVGFRMESGGKSVVFASDHELTEAPDPLLSNFARGADLIYLEGQYTQLEYEGKQGLPGERPLPRINWGHSPVEGCVKTAVAAGVRNCHIGHRDPVRSDDNLAAMEEYARGILRGELAAAGKTAEDCALCIPHEGMTIQF